MKKVIVIFLIFFSIISCDDFLVEPISFVSEDQFYKTQEDAISVVNAVPLHVEEFSSIREFAIPRANVDEIYNLIISDLIIAEKDLKLRSQQLQSRDL